MSFENCDNSLKKIIIADPANLIRVMMSSFLENKYDVIGAGSGAEVMKILESVSPISALILSLELSDMSGFDVASKVRESYSSDRLPILLNTSNNKQEVILKALEVGVNDYIVKPFPQELLLSKLNKLEQEIPVQKLKQSALISKIPFFKGVPESQVAFALKTCSQTLKKDRGEVICSQNDANYDLYILLEGKCDVLFNNKKVSEITPVDIIGEMGFIQKEKRSATVTATEASTVICLDHESFDDFLNEDRALSELICKNVIDTFSERIKRTNTLIERLKTLSYELFKY